MFNFSKFMIRQLSTIPKKPSIIQVTDTAIRLMKNIITDSDYNYFNFYADSGGCNGFTYHLHL